jgi:hypothetical protein
MSSPADKCASNVRNVTKITDKTTSKCEAEPELRIAHSPPEEIRGTELVDQEPCPIPINRLGFDILSLVFELCSEDDWTAPLRIGVINRQWREVILATLRAWTLSDWTISTVQNLRASISREAAGTYTMFILTINSTSTFFALYPIVFSAL